MNLGVHRTYSCQSIYPRSETHSLSLFFYKPPRNQKWTFSTVKFRRNCVIHLRRAYRSRLLQVQAGEFRGIRRLESFSGKKKGGEMTCVGLTREAGRACR